jgi:hypothetical protein
MSSVEIPAEQLENLKAGMSLRKKFRSKSESAACTSEDSLVDNDFEMNLAFNDSDRKRHKSVTVVPNVKNPRQSQASQNILAVSLKSLKYPQPEKQTMTDENCAVNEENRIQNELNLKNEILQKFQLETEELKKMLNEKNELINRQNEQQRQLNEIKSTEIALCQQKNENLNTLLDNQQSELLALKNKLSTDISSFIYLFGFV